VPRTVIWVTLALLAGLALGAWGPRSDLAKMKARMIDLEERLKERPGGAGRLRSVTDMLRIPAAEETAPEEPAPAAPAEPAAETDSGGAPAPASANATHAPAPKDLRQRIDEAAELWRVRSDVARNSFVSGAGLEREQAMAFDVLMAAMNIRLGTSISNWVGRVKEKEDLRPEDGARILNELSSVFVLTYDEMDRKLPPGWREGAGERFDLITFVDPSVAMPLVGIETELEQARERRP
jgi:hypothetical protein